MACSHETQFSSTMLFLVFLFPICTYSKTSKVSQYQLVSRFLPGTEATIAVAGDTGNGCKFVLLDRLEGDTK